MKKTEHIVKKVYEGSIADELDIVPGDIVVSINQHTIEDVFDYRYLIKDEFINVVIRKTDGEEWELEIEKDYDDDLGIEFENGLMSDYRSCSNKCIFCFIDQMPPGMRETLYFKDDDSRLSFLQGNYITLTNMNDKDIDRIIKMQLSPINISVQTTNPELRCKMLNNRFAGEKLHYLKTMYDGKVEMNGQVVCCKNVNDGKELERTIDDLSEYLPYMQSVSIVPAGITKYREGLYPIELFTKEEAGHIIDMIESRQQGYYDKYGLHFIHASDEWYITAEREFPEESRYDGYLQLENGVGMMRLFINEFEEAFDNLMSSEGIEFFIKDFDRTVTMATGKLTYPTIKKFADKLMQKINGLRINVVCIRNDFFGETITVSGLITGQDLVNQVKEHRDKGITLGDTLIIPSNMLRSGEKVFLDDMTVEDSEKMLDIKITAVEASGKEFIDSIINKEYSMDRNNDNFVYIQAYNK